VWPAEFPRHAGTEADEAQEQTVGESRGSSKVAVIEVEGMLMNAKSGGVLGIGAGGENKVSLFAQQLEMAEMDARVKAIAPHRIIARSAGLSRCAPCVTPDDAGGNTVHRTDPRARSHARRTSTGGAQV